MYGIGEKVDSHVVSIKHIELHMTHLSTIVNPCKPDTLPSNTIHNLRKYGHCMTGTTRGVEQTIDQPMLSMVETDNKKNFEVREVNRESATVMEKEAKFT